MSLRRFVTAKWLREQWACPEAVDAFLVDWGEHGRPTVFETFQACWKRHQNYAPRDAATWTVWLAGHLFPTTFYHKWSMAAWGAKSDRRIAREYQRLADAQGKKRKRKE